MIQPDDMEAAISRVQDFMDVQGSGTTKALELHLQAAGITLPAVFKLAEHLMASQDPPSRTRSRCSRHRPRRPRLSPQRSHANAKRV